jgi:hypothetical protein
MSAKLLGSAAALVNRNLKRLGGCCPGRLLDLKRRGVFHEQRFAEFMMVPLIRLNRVAASRRLNDDTMEQWTIPGSVE